LMILLDVDHVLSINELSNVANMADESNTPSVSQA
jgi:hypothetical protein